MWVRFETKYLDTKVSVLSAVGLVLPVLFLGFQSANERRRYKVTPSLIGWEQT